MVRPNQIIERDGKKLTFLMFARSKTQVKRRVLATNFPISYFMRMLSSSTTTEPVTSAKLFTEGRVNRYEVTVDTSKL